MVATISQQGEQFTPSCALLRCGIDAVDDEKEIQRFPCKKEAILHRPLIGISPVDLLCHAITLLVVVKNSQRLVQEQGTHSGVREPMQKPI
jgi:hypothetical protein